MLSGDRFPYVTIYSRCLVSRTGAERGLAGVRDGAEKILWRRWMAILPRNRVMALVEWRSQSLGFRARG